MKNSILYFKRFAAIFLVFAAILSSTPFVIYGNEIIADDMAVLIPEQDFDSALEALAYSYPPDNLYPFIYDGTPPSTWRNINTAECVIGRLYVFNEDTGAVTPIGSHTVVTFATTKDHLFYVTDDQTIAITDYTGSFFTPIYQPKQGTITMLSAYGNFLHFVEDECAVVVLDVPNQAIKVRISHSAISSAYMFDEDKLIWYDAQGNAKYYNMTSQQTITLADEAEESNLVSAYLAPNVPADTAAVQSSTVVNSVGIPDAYNDITFPLAEYPATPAMTNYTLPSPVRSRFLENSINGSLPKTIVSKKYAGEPECDGFAKYAHDVFWHVADTSRTGPSWYNNSTYSLDCHWNKTWSSEQEMIDFFEGLSRGSFVRYVSKGDTSPVNGTHSYVFDGVHTDGLGAWHYECNQDKKCGVGYQYYTFRLYFERNKNILYYIEHVPTEAPVYYDSSRHTVGCVNCDGYLRQTHTSEITALSTIQHGYTCCTGGESNHTGIYTYSKYSNDYHWVSYACCFGRVKQEHTYTAGVNSYCTRCGQVKQGPAITPITPFKKTPAEVTLTE